MQRFKVLGATMLVCLVALVAAVTAGADEQDTAPVWNGAAAQSVPVQDEAAPETAPERGDGPRGEDCPEKGGAGGGGSSEDDSSSSDATPAPTPDV